MKPLPEKLYLHDHGYHVSVRNGQNYEQDFKNVFISDNKEINDPNYLMDFRVYKESEKTDMQIAKIMTNSIEMATLCIDLCAWVTALSHTHGIEDEESAALVRKLRSLARPV